MSIAITRASLDAEGRAYPRPQLERDSWCSLNGLWDFSFDPVGRWQGPDEVPWATQIRVPFSPEAPASGIGDTSFYRACWYRKRCALPDHDSGRRWLLHFGAVDYRATVWVNGAYAGGHEGGYRAVGRQPWRRVR